MKKLLFLFISCLTISSIASAQAFRLGVKAGADVQKVTGKAWNEEFRFGYHVGGYAEIKLQSKVSVQPEVYFSQVNVKTATNINQITPELNNINSLQLSYLNIPLLLNIKASQSLMLQVGPQFGVLLDQNKNLINNGKDAFKKGDFSVTGGLQLVVLKRLNIYGRYVVGLNDINDLTTTDKWKKQTIHFGLGYNIL